MRCNLCGEVFTAPAPDVGDEKYDATAASMIGLLKYGAGLPFNRIEKLQAGFGIPLPAATQWEICGCARSPAAGGNGSSAGCRPSADRSGPTAFRSIVCTSSASTPIE